MIETLLNAIKQKLEEQFKDAEVMIRSGGFNGVDDLKDFINYAACFGVGINDISSNDRTQNAQLESTCDLSIYLVCDDSSKTEFGDGALEAYKKVENVLLLVKDGIWGCKNTFATEYKSITAKNYHSEDFYKSGVYLWEINWKQKILLGEDIWTERGVFPSCILTNMDIEAEKKEQEKIVIKDAKHTK